MRKQFDSDSELKNLIETQFVFTEVLPRGEEFDLFEKTYNIKITDSKELPRCFIISSQGKMVADVPGTAGREILLSALQDGIEKTGGLKGAAGAKKRLEAALQEVEDAKGMLASKDTALEGILSLVKLERTHSKTAVIKNDIRKVLAKAATDSGQKELVQQARMLDAAAQMADSKRTTQAIARYQDVVKKFPDTPAATLAQEKITAIEGSKANSDEKKPASTDKTEKAETALGDG